MYVMRAMTRAYPLASLKIESSEGHVVAYYNRMLKEKVEQDTNYQEDKTRHQVKFV